MAPDKKEKKRKAATATDPPAKKTKKAEAKTSEATKETAPKPVTKKKQNATEKPHQDKTDSAVKANAESTRHAKPRKRAADFLSDEESDEAAAPAKTASQKKAGAKKSKKEESEPAPATPKAARKNAKASSKGKKVEEVAEESEDEDVDVVVSDESEVDGEDEGEDDQTAALIKGFESSGDEDESGDEGYKPGQPVPKIPDSKKTQRKILKKQKQKDTPEEPGTVYIGYVITYVLLFASSNPIPRRIPHGFYEHQMRAYFTQFGEITRLRLSRNRFTGRSKHYAFVEFASTTVAKIVAETMDNYLMYSHILKCKYVPQEQLHPEVWKGANRRFKRTPWNRIEKKRLEKGKTREQWSKRIEQEQRKRQAKANKLKALGYEVDLPQLKSVEDVPMQDAPQAIEAAEATPEEPKAAEEPKAIEAPAQDDTPKKSKKEKKEKEGKKMKKSKKAEEETPQQASSDSPATKTQSKAKKGEKSKAKA
ncbi:Nucleotide-binding alpha-beta plait-containing protein [Penicillium alfredii]|uniref:Nucleotide-binding alpha-beta plait-containing protein n=1 Tax=Penicillium alfredii TaxID=1506179 RepID=A0A9W9EGR9_9EURO|nr:Nucleotide-binding alpha-beta plait-containing protein [Penicillium alfredii]KAJ5081469.1 Nucleotide-binding alpha-beta plait-containing protein [Penicillium alfredii]